MTSYRVAGKHAVLGNAPGAEFEADIPETQVARLIASGALELAGEPANEPTPGPDSTE